MFHGVRLELYAFFLGSFPKFTFLNVSREHTMTSIEQISTGCWVFARKMRYIRCNSMGNKCQLHSHNLSVNCWNWPVCVPPNSHTIYNTLNKLNITQNGGVNSIQFVASFDLKQNKHDMLKKFKLFFFSYEIKSEWNLGLGTGI